MRPIGISKLDRLPPHSIEAEQGVLGCCFHDPQEIVPRLLAEIPPDAFYDVRHQTIRHAFSDLEDRATMADVITVSDALTKRGELETCGGIGYLSGLYDAAPSAANFRFYAEIVLEKHKLRLLLRAATKAIQAVHESGEPAESVVADHLAAIEALTKADLGRVETAKQVLGRVIDRLQTVHQGTAVQSIKTGMDRYDHLAGGLWPSHLVLIAARPSVGKTALLMQLVEQAARQAYPCVVFSEEMSSDQLVERVAGGQAEANTREAHNWTQGDFTRFTAAAGRLAKLPILLDDTPGISVERLRATVKELVKKHGVKVVGVDYIQLLTTERSADIREQEIAHISRTLKRIARENDITVIALSQLNRESEKRGSGTPKLSQLRESGALEQDADVGILLYRQDGEENESARYKGTPFPVVLDVQKNRFGGVFRSTCTFDPRRQQFTETTDIQ